MPFYFNFNIDHKKSRKNTKIKYYKSICYTKKIVQIENYIFNLHDLNKYSCFYDRQYILVLGSNSLYIALIHKIFIYKQRIRF